MVQSNPELVVKVTFSVDAGSESGADFFYEIINTPFLNCAVIVNQIYFHDSLCPRSFEICHTLC